MSTNGETADLMVREGIQITESALMLLRQIVTAVADGAMAVHMAEEYVEK